MTRKLHTHFLPSLVEPESLRGSITVAIDVLRASTTICHALHAGATAVVPCETVEAARQRAAEMAAERPLLGGERHGRRIDGFELDNSPLRYTPNVVNGRPIVFTTTNGTRALARCRFAERILIGAFVNRSAIVETLRETTADVHLVCAGTDGCITSEDVLFAGAVALELTHHDVDLQWNDESRIAAEFYEHATSRHGLFDALRRSAGGKNLRALNFEADIERAAEVNRFDFVAVFSPRTGRIEIDSRS